MLNIRARQALWLTLMHYACKNAPIHEHISEEYLFFNKKKMEEMFDSKKRDKLVNIELLNGT